MIDTKQLQSSSITAYPKFPLASIIIVNYNAGSLLDDCLCSLRADAHDDYEIILVDNASTDGSAERAERTFPEVYLIKSPVNLGFGGGNNLGAQLSHGEYLAFLNPDTVIESGWLKALIAALDSDPRAGFATSRILMIDDPLRINTCGNVMHYTGLTLCRGLGEGRDAYRQPDEVSAISGAAFAARRTAFEQLGGFDAGFFLYVEDSDLSLRARLAGYRLLYVPDSIVYHHYRLRFGALKTYYQERNRYWMLLKSLRWRTLLALVPGLLLTEILTWGYILAYDQQRVFNKLNAYLWILSHWQEWSAQRWATQQTRQVSDRELLGLCSTHLAVEVTKDGRLARVVHAFFDPQFALFKRLALAVAG